MWVSVRWWGKIVLGVFDGGVRDSSMWVSDR